MTVSEPVPINTRPISAPEATAALAAADVVMRRSRRAAIGQCVRAPLVYWGVVWIVGYTAAQFLPGWLASLTWLLFIAGEILSQRLGSRVGGERVVISGWEGQIRRAWWVVVLGSSALPFIIEPVPTSVLYLFFGALWGIVYMLYAVISEDRELTYFGAGIVLLAVVVRIVIPDLSLLVFGVLAGGGKMIFGLVRMRRQWDA